MSSGTTLFDSNFSDTCSELCSGHVTSSLYVYVHVWVGGNRTSNAELNDMRVDARCLLREAKRQKETRTGGV